MKGYRTITFNVLASILPVLELTEFKAVIPADYLPQYMLAVALVNLYLRKITTTPIGKK